MLWKRLFQPVKTLEPKEVENFIAGRREGTFQLRRGEDL
jgi:hypothetical protein